MQLKQLKFEYCLSGIHLWEDTRNLNSTTIEDALATTQLPRLIGVFHSCIDCIVRMKPCTHQCCKEYFLSRRKVQIFNIATSTSTPDHRITEPFNMRLCNKIPGGCSTHAPQVAEELIQLFSRVGVPEEILTNQGSNFTSQLITEIYKILHVHPIRTTPYHPQTDSSKDFKKHAEERSNGRRKRLG